MKPGSPRPFQGSGRGRCRGIHFLFFLWQESATAANAMARQKRKLSLHSQRRCLEEATKYLDIGIELVAKALDYVKMAELTDASIAREFQSTFDKLCTFSATLNGHI